MLSTVIPGLIIVVAMWIANSMADTYGVALAAVGMLSTLGITLATDAYGPVAGRTVLCPQASESNRPSFNEIP